MSVEEGAVGSRSRQAPSSNRSVLRTSAIPYLIALVIAVVVSRIAQYLWQYIWPQIPLIQGQAPGIYVQALGVLVMLILWLLYRGRPTRQPLFIAFVSILLAGWVVFIILARLRNDGFAYEVILYPMVLAAIALKAPKAQDIKVALVTLAWVVTGTLVISRASEMTHLIPMVDVGKDLRAFEMSHYWLPLSGTLGPEGRWPGPFGHNAMTGNAAAMLVVLGVAIKDRSRWVFAIVGILALLLTSSRTSMIGCAAGVIVVLALGDNAATRKFGRWAVSLAFGVVLILSIIFLLQSNPGASGRTGYWATSLAVWQTSPVWGVGAEGMADSPAWFVGTNSHNLLVDALIKTGVVGALIVAAALLVAGVLGWLAAQRGSVLPLGLFAAYLVIGIAESDQGWMSLSMPWLWLVLAATMAGAIIQGALPENSHPSDHQRVSEPETVAESARTPSD